jgi:hypothetical protein
LDPISISVSPACNASNSFCGKLRTTIESAWASSFSVLSSASCFSRVLAFLYVFFGYAPVATASPPLPLERYMAKLGLNARIRIEMPKDSPMQPTEENLTAGAKLYRDHCAVCHGTVDQPKTATAKGMFPPPPQLLQGKGVTDDPVGETD